MLVTLAVPHGQYVNFKSELLGCRRDSHVCALKLVEQQLLVGAFFQMLHLRVQMSAREAEYDAKLTKEGRAA